MSAICLLLGLASGTAHYDDHLWWTDACGLVGVAESEDSSIVTIDGYRITWPEWM